MFAVSFIFWPAIAGAVDSPLSGAVITSIEKISPADIRRLPIADFNLAYGKDSDRDGLSDEISYALLLRPAIAEKHAQRKQAVLSGLSKDGASTLDFAFADSKKGVLLLEPLGKSVFSWFVNPADGKAYYLGNALINSQFLERLGVKVARFKKIEVSIAKQKLFIYLGPVKLGTMKISSGKDGWLTPIGTFKTLNKVPRAWSKLAQLWMPNWMAFAGGGKFGIHELPEWPSGRKEGENHLGLRVSHGCIRLGPADAKLLYNWTPIGTPMVVKK